MSRCYLDLWAVDLQSSWYVKRHVIRVFMKFERNRAVPGWIIDNFVNVCTCYLTLWSWPLTSSPWTFTVFQCPVLKLCTERKRIIYGYWRFSTLSHAIVGGGSQLTELSEGCVNPTSPNLAMERAIIAALHSCFTSRIVRCVFKRGRLEVEWCRKRRQILHFWPPCEN